MLWNALHPFTHVDRGEAAKDLLEDGIGLSLKLLLCQLGCSLVRLRLRLGLLTLLVVHRLRLWPDWTLSRCLVRPFSLQTVASRSTPALTYIKSTLRKNRFLKVVKWAKGEILTVLSFWLEQVTFLILSDFFYEFYFLVIVYNSQNNFIIEWLIHTNNKNVCLSNFRRLC